MNDKTNREKVDENFVQALLESEFTAHSTNERIGALVDNVISQIETATEAKAATFQHCRRFLTRVLGFCAATAATLLAIAGVGWLLLGSSSSAQAEVIKVLERTLAAGPRKYDAHFTYYGPIRGEFSRKGNCYIDGHKKFAFRIPCPLGFAAHWYFGSDGEKLWASGPGKFSWLDDTGRLEKWWESRGFEDAPILHIEAILDTLSQSYDLKNLSEHGAGRRIAGVANEKTPASWAKEIELTIDNETGFARTIVLNFGEGRLRKVVMQWDESAKVSLDVFQPNIDESDKLNNEIR